MADDKESGLHLFSLGIVLEDKPEKSDKIKVVPIEHLTRMNGLLSKVKINYDTSLPDHRGVTQTDKLEGGPDIVASWMPDGNDNRLTSPDVYKSETVKIYRMGDTNEYYWKTIFREPTLRRQETVINAVSNIKSGNAAYDLNSSYWTKVDTRYKLFQIHTSNNDGEPFVYDIVIDTAAGSVTIGDDVGNFIKMDSSNDLLSLTSIAGANVDLNKGHIKMHGKTITMTADEKITMAAPNTEINSETQHNGNFSIAGGVSATEGLSVTGGGGSISGDVKLEGGNITMTGGSITANGEDLNVDQT